MAELRRCKSILFALFLVVFTALEYGAEGRTVFSSRIRDKRDLNAIQAQLIKVLNPRPVVDSIVSQKEKFGNFGEHPLGRKFVESFAALSNKVNLILAVPAQKLESVSKGTTEFLNMIGARLVGLQKK